MKKLTLKQIIKILESMFSEENLRPYKDLSNDLYELPGNITCNKMALINI